MASPRGKSFRPRHWAVLDYAVGGLLALILFAAITHAVRQEIVFPPGATPPVVVRYYPLPGASALGTLLVAVAAVAVALRRRRPMVMLGVLLAGSVIVTALAGEARLPGVFPAGRLRAVPDRGELRARRDAVRVLAAVFATLVVDVAVITLAGGSRAVVPAAVVPVALCVIVVWTTGYIVRQRRRYAVRLQEEAASKAVTQERLRIARELHDVVAHSMSVIAVQAGYGQYVIDSQPGDARDALGAIQATSREALEEMRRMLGALRHADEDDGAGASAEASAGAGVGASAGAGVGAGVGASGGDSPAGRPTAPLSPAPGLADLDRLLSRTAGAGVAVEVLRRGDVRELPASIDLSAYRIVQEALTNVVKHAQTSSCRVLIGYRDDELIIEVTDNGAGVQVPGTAGAGVQVAALAGVGSGAGAGLAGSGGAHHGPHGLDRRSLARHVFSADGAAAPVRGLGGMSSNAVPGGGHGIIGMRERVSLLGGEFSAGPLPGYGFRVSARIPLPPGSA